MTVWFVTQTHYRSCTFRRDFFAILVLCHSEQPLFLVLHRLDSTCKCVCYKTETGLQPDNSTAVHYILACTWSNSSRHSAFATCSQNLTSSWSSLLCVSACACNSDLMGLSPWNKHAEPHELLGLPSCSCQPVIRCACANLKTRQTHAESNHICVISACSEGHIAQAYTHTHTTHPLTDRHELGRIESGSHVGH